MIAIGDKVRSKICKNLFGTIKDMLPNNIILVLIDSDKELVSHINYWNQI